MYIYLNSKQHTAKNPVNQKKKEGKNYGKDFKRIIKP